LAVWNLLPFRLAKINWKSISALRKAPDLRMKKFFQSKIELLETRLSQIHKKALVVYKKYERFVPIVCFAYGFTSDTFFLAVENLSDHFPDYQCAYLFYLSQDLQTTPVEGCWPGDQLCDCFWHNDFLLPVELDSAGADFAQRERHLSFAQSRSKRGAFVPGQVLPPSPISILDR